MTIKDDVLQTMKPIPYEKARKRVRTGDILLCSAHDPFSKLIRWSTRSPWSHIAIAYRMQHVDRVMVLESVEKIGVRTVPLSRFISETSAGTKPYPGEILLARHTGFDPDGAHMERMAGFAFDQLGNKFAAAEIFKIALRVAIGRFQRHMPRSLGPKDEFICSEYLARCFKEAELEIPWDGLGFVAPADFARDPNIKAVCQIQTR